MRRDRLRATETSGGRKIAIWHLEGALAVMDHADIRDDHSIVGVLRFHPAAHIDLAAARERYPEHEDLWDAVRQARLSALYDTCEIPVAPADPSPGHNRPTGVSTS